MDFKDTRVEVKDGVFVAKEDINAREVVFVEKAFVSSLDPDFLTQLSLIEYNTEEAHIARMKLLMTCL